MSKDQLKLAGHLERRRDRRISIPALTVAFDGAVYPARDWSLGGFSIEGYRGEREIGETITVEFRGSVADVELHARAKAVVVRMYDDKLAACFSIFPADAWDTLEQLSIRRVRRSKQPGGA